MVAVDHVRFGPELIARLLDHLCAELSGCLGVALVVWGDGEPQTLMARGAAEGRETDAETHGGLDHQVTVEDVDGMGFVAVPGGWGDGGPVVLTLYFDHPPGSTDLRVVEEIEPMLTMAAAVVEFCAGEVLRADQMVAMMQHRRVIEQAKGLVMARTGTPAGEAFQLLVRASQHANVKLRELCSGLVLHVSGTLDETDVVPVPSPGDEAREVARRMWAALQPGSGR